MAVAGSIVGVRGALMTVFDRGCGEARVWCATVGQVSRRNFKEGEMGSAYGPKSEGVPEGSLGGGGRLMRVGPEIRDISEGVGVVGTFQR